jgi:hypothetical protein
VTKISPTTKSTESLESDFSRTNAYSNSATSKQNVSKIQAPLPPLKKKMGIVKQNVPPPVPPRGSPRALKHQSPKSGVTFNSDIKMGNVSPGIGTLQRPNKLMKSNNDLRDQVQLEIQKNRVYRSTADLTNNSPYTRPLVKSMSHNVQNWLALNNFDVSLEAVGNIKHKNSAENPKASVQNLIHSYDTLPKAKSVPEMPRTPVNCPPIAHKKPAFVVTSVSCREETLKDVNDIRRGFVRDTKKSLLNQPTTATNVKPKLDIRISNHEFNKVRNEFTGRNPTATSAKAVEKTNTKPIPLKAKNLTIPKRTSEKSDQEYYV